MAKWTADATGVHPIYHALMGTKSLPYLDAVPHAPAPLALFTAGQVPSSCRAASCMLYNSSRNHQRQQSPAAAVAAAAAVTSREAAASSSSSSYQ